MKRLIIICEGPTEQAFCKSTLQVHLQNKNVLIQTPLIKHSMGGIIKWSLLKQQIETHLKTDSSAFVTTFIDYYGLYAKHSFPGWDEYENPEIINNVKETSPSHRLERIIRGYNKIVYGDILAEAIGLHRIRSKSPRFNAWITKLETMGV